MANIKINQSNFDNKLTEWRNNVGATRADSLYFVSSEINELEIRSAAWRKNLLINISSVDGFSSKITYIDILT